MLKRRDRRSINSLSNTRSLFQPFEATYRFVHAVVQQRNRFVQMRLLHRNLPYSLRQEATGRNLNRLSGHTYPDGIRSPVKQLRRCGEGKGTEASAQTDRKVLSWMENASP